tara:strand:+ start:6323 stop:6475 length:153 start_codon:yes stop_codon:yes gene_type:complete
MIDVFLIKDGIVANIIVIESLDLAQQLFPDLTAVERTDDNKHINPGDSMS